MRVLVWIAFDLGVRGDYEGMYEFLDAHSAKECGDNLGALTFEYNNDLVKELTKELRKAVQFDKRSRVYLIFPGENKAYKGRFIIGKRKAPPWTGYGATGFDEEDTGG